MGKEVSSVRGSLWNLGDGWFGAHCEVVGLSFSLFRSWWNHSLMRVWEAADPRARARHPCGRGACPSCTWSSSRFLA